ncbi:MAG: glycosyltransferase family 2 protein [Dehalococcoidia bacterium]
MRVFSRILRLLWSTLRRLTSRAPARRVYRSGSFILEEEQDTIRIVLNPGSSRQRPAMMQPVFVHERRAKAIGFTDLNLGNPVASLAGAGRGLRARFTRHKPPLRIGQGVAAAVIPAHNEATVIAATLRTVLEQYRREDVYVFCDNCTDATVSIAREFLPAGNVIESPAQMGKSRGLEYMFNNYIFPQKYPYVTVIDADTTIEKNFLLNSLKTLRYKDVACVVGQVKSRWYAKNVISVYRTYVYTIWQMLYKRLQSLTNAITIASGCSTTWKTRVLMQLDFDHSMSTEDFSLTIQVHRKRLGKIKYVPSAVVWTQDPFSITSYRKQQARWERAWWESVRKYKIGARWVHTKHGLPVGLSVLDLSTLLLTLDILFFSFTLVALPVFFIHPVNIRIGLMSVGTRSAIIHSMIWQFAIISLSALFVSLVTRRPRVFLYSPVFVFLMYLDIFVSMRTIASTIKSQYRPGQVSGGHFVSSAWVSPERMEVQ